MIRGSSLWKLESSSQLQMSPGHTNFCGDIGSGLHTGVADPNSPFSLPSPSTDPLSGPDNLLISSPFLLSHIPTVPGDLLPAPVPGYSPPSQLPITTVDPLLLTAFDLESSSPVASTSSAHLCRPAQEPHSTVAAAAKPSPPSTHPSTMQHVADLVHSPFRSSSLEGISPPMGHLAALQPGVPSGNLTDRGIVQWELDSSGGASPTTVRRSCGGSCSHAPRAQGLESSSQRPSVSSYGSLDVQAWNHLQGVGYACTLDQAGANPEGLPEQVSFSPISSPKPKSEWPGWFGQQEPMADRLGFIPMPTEAAPVAGSGMPDLPEFLRCAKQPSAAANVAAWDCSQQPAAELTRRPQSSPTAAASAQPSSKRHGHTLHRFKHPCQPINQAKPTTGPPSGPALPTQTSLHMSKAGSTTLDCGLRASSAAPMQPAASSLDALVRLPHGQPQGSTPAASTGSMMMMPIMTAGRRLVIVPHGQTAKALGVPKPLEIPKPMAIPNLDALYPVLKQEPHSQRGQHAQDWSGQGGAPPGLFMQASDIGGSAGPPSGCAEGAAGRAAARAAAQITEQAGSQGLRRSTRATKPMRAISSNEMSVSDDPEEAEAPSPKRGKVPDPLLSGARTDLCSVAVRKHFLG